jgi:hypothetical protein
MTVFKCAPPDPDEKKTAHNMPDVPKLPQPPMGKWENTLTRAMKNMFAKNDFAAAFRSMQSVFESPLPVSSIVRSIAAQVPHPRDKHAFYWKEYPGTLSNKWVLECEEFRHKVEPKVRSMRLQVPREGMVDRFVVRCRVTGSNLPDPSETRTVITIQWERKKVIEVIADILSRAYGHGFGLDPQDDEAEE